MEIRTIQREHNAEPAVRRENATVGARQALDRHDRRYGLRFGDFEAQLSEADVVQLHDTVLHLDGAAEPNASRFCGQLRALLEGGSARPTLTCDVDAARMVQLAVLVMKQWRKPVDEALVEARLQAFRYLDQEGVVEALQSEG